ncbi:MAG: membrane protein insertase YidC, partial [Syntrophaceae bacterium]|nr:membrane protein insertase YidC [Syntrophaceae bacterium]
MDKRTLLAIILSLIVILTWQAFFAKKPPPQQPEPTQQETPAAGKPAVKETARAQFTPSTTRTVLSQKIAGSEKDITVVTPLFTAIFTTKGGSLKSYKLKEYRTTIDGTSDLVELVHLMDGMQKPLSITFPESNVDILPESIFTADSSALDLTQDQESKKLTFTQLYPNEMKVEKI